MAANIPGDRKLMFGEMAGGETVNWANRADLDGVENFDLSAFGGAEVVPVVARPHVFMKPSAELMIDRSAEVVCGDVTDEMTLTPFERTQRDYDGTGAFSGFDDNPAELFTGDL